MLAIQIHIIMLLCSRSQEPSRFFAISFFAIHILAFFSFSFTFAFSFKCKRIKVCTDTPSISSIPFMFFPLCLSPIFSFLILRTFRKAFFYFLPTVYVATKTINRLRLHPPKSPFSNTVLSDSSLGHTIDVEMSNEKPINEMFSER